MERRLLRQRYKRFHDEVISLSVQIQWADARRYSLTLITSDGVGEIRTFKEKTNISKDCIKPKLYLICTLRHFITFRSEAFRYMY